MQILRRICGGRFVCWNRLPKFFVRGHQLRKLRPKLRWILQLETGTSLTPDSRSNVQPRQTAMEFLKDACQHLDLHRLPQKLLCVHLHDLHAPPKMGARAACLVMTCRRSSELSPKCVRVTSKKSNCVRVARPPTRASASPTGPRMPACRRRCTSLMPRLLAMLAACKGSD